MVAKATRPATRASSIARFAPCSQIEKNKGWYLEHGRISPARSKQVPAAVNDLCAELRPHAQSLVDAFGIPRAWLGTELLEPLT